MLALEAFGATFILRVTKIASNSLTFAVFDGRIGFGTKNYAYTLILSSWDPPGDLF